MSPSAAPTLSGSLPAKIVNVAVAVIHYQNQYLLGFRSQAQHQGNRYEFVGGKIEDGELPQVALIREVAEETGIDITENVAIKMGRLHHDYGDKIVCLHVYDVALSTTQFAPYKAVEQGLEGQALTWADKDKLLAGEYPLPAANSTILAWLTLPPHIAITYPLAHFDASSPALWLSYHQSYLPIGSWVYCRPKAAQQGHETIPADTTLDRMVIQQLLQARPDISGIAPWTDTAAQNDELSAEATVCAYHLSHSQLMAWFAQAQHQDNQADKEEQILPALQQPLIVSCHDISSIEAANQLARIRLAAKLPPVIGMFLSPVLATPTHPDETGLGWQAWAALALRADIPVIALGGLYPDMSAQAAEQGALGIAGIRHFHECQPSSLL